MSRNSPTAKGCSSSEGGGQDGSGDQAVGKHGYVVVCRRGGRPHGSTAGPVETTRTVYLAQWQRSRQLL